MTRTIDAKSASNQTLYRYLSAAVAPRPVCFASTIDQEGKVNLSPYSFFNVFSSNPPIMIFSPVRSGRDNTTKNTLDNVLEVKQVVINIVNYAVVEQMSLASTAYAKGVNEFVKSGLTAIPSERVAPPRVAECPVAFECTVQQVIPLGTEGGAGNLVIAKVELIHVQEAYLDEEGFLDTEKLDLIARMGENWYCRASGDALFEVPKPLRQLGIGVDQLPAHIRNSHLFSGNDLGRMGNIEALPAPAFIAEMAQVPAVAALLEAHKSHPKALEGKLVELAKKHLAEREPLAAVAVAMLIEQ